MPTCPVCSVELGLTRHREGLYYPCAHCEGRALTVPQVHRVFGDSVATKVLRLMRVTSARGSLRCPFCLEAMHRIQSQTPRWDLDVCRSCALVWFDAPTFDSLPQVGFGSTNTLAMQANDILAMTRLNEFNERAEAEKKNARQKTGLRRFLRKRPSPEKPPET